MKGRKPLPAKVRRLRGKSGKKRRSRAAAALSGTAPLQPDYLSERAKKEWSRIRKILVRHGLLTGLDRAALAAYCTAYGRWAEAEEALKRTPLLIRGAKGKTQENPYLAIAERSLEQMRKMLVEFGLTPSARSRLEGLIAPPDDELERFLEDRKGSYRRSHGPALFERGTGPTPSRPDAS